MAAGTSYLEAKYGERKELRTAAPPMTESMQPRAIEIYLPLNQELSRTGTATYTEPVPAPITYHPAKSIP
jgi:hypothetical protein